MITSKSNYQIKQIRKLRNRKQRRQNGLFYIEGLHIVAEAIHQNAKLDVIIVAPEILVSDFGWQMVRSQCEHGVAVLEVSKDVFKHISLKDRPQGVAAVVKQLWIPLEEARITTDATWVVLDSIQDPGNLGTIIRTQDAVGGVGVILLDHATDPFDPTAVRASMGAIFTQQLVKTSFDEFASWKRSHAQPLIGTSDGAQVDYQAVTYPSSLLLLMGSERQGLQECHIQLCDELVSIPMIGRSDSLNLAVATAIVLYEIFNQRRKRPAHLKE